MALLRCRYDDAEACVAVAVDSAVDCNWRCHDAAIDCSWRGYKADSGDVVDVVESIVHAIVLSMDWTLCNVLNLFDMVSFFAVTLPSVVTKVLLTIIFLDMSVMNT